MIIILLIGSVSIPTSVMASNDKNDKNDKDNGNDDHYYDHYEHSKKPDSCQNIPRETPFRYLWVFVCSLQTQIDQINTNLNHNTLVNLSCIDGQIPKFKNHVWICAADDNSGGGGTPSTSGGNCPTAQNINVSGLYLVLANLSGCNLSGATMTDADLRYANLQGANLDGANLGGAWLTNADLTGASTTGTIFDSHTHGTCIGNPICSTLSTP